MITEHEMLVTLASMALKMNDLTGEDVLDTFRQLGYGGVVAEARELKPPPKKELTPEEGKLRDFLDEHVSTSTFTYEAHAGQQERLYGTKQERLSRLMPAVDSVASTLREPVQWFADRMEAKLRLNDHKGHWSNCDFPYLDRRLDDEVHELKHARSQLNYGSMIDEAVDVANFALMIADNARRKI